MTMEQLMTKFEELADLKKFNSARSLLEDSLRLITGTKNAMLVNYQLGTLYWSFLGDGEEARRCYETVIDIKENDFFDLKTNAFENMMILSKSYEEYMNWAEKLKEKKPDADVIKGQYPHVLIARDAGHKWYIVLMSFAETYYNRNDTRLDAGMYGCAASIYQILLDNRKILRIPKDDLRIIFFEYIALMWRIISDAILLAQNKGMNIDPDDYMFMIEKAFAYRDQYIEIDELDEHMNNIINSIQEYKNMLDELRSGKYKAPVNPGEFRRLPMNESLMRMYGAPMNPGEVRCRRCGHLNPKNSIKCSDCSTFLKTSGSSSMMNFILAAVIIAGVIYGIGLFFKWW